MAKKFIVNLNTSERDELLEMLSQGKVSARMVKRANILMLADEGRKDEEIVASLIPVFPR
jgi:hypothetical protein